MVRLEVRNWVRGLRLTLEVLQMLKGPLASSPHPLLVEAGLEPCWVCPQVSHPQDLGKRGRDASGSLR